MARSSVMQTADCASAARANREFQMSDVAKRVKEIVRQHLDLDDGKVTEAASFENDLGADSLDITELVMAFEEEFDVHIPNSATEGIQTVGDAVRVIEKASRTPHK
jgi:acyl carrier protein